MNKNEFIGIKYKFYDIIDTDTVFVKPITARYGGWLS